MCVYKDGTQVSGGVDGGDDQQVGREGGSGQQVSGKDSAAQQAPSALHVSTCTLETWDECREVWGA